MEPLILRRRGRVLQPLRMRTANDSDAQFLNYHVISVAKGVKRPPILGLLPLHKVLVDALELVLLREPGNEPARHISADAGDTK